MIKNLAAVALLGASAVYATPVAWGPPGYTHTTTASTPTPSYPGSPEQGSTGGQVPFKFPLANGFPNIKVPSSALTAIEKQAHGTLPNAPLSTTLLNGDQTIFELIAFNELFEVAFFTSLIGNITNNVEGFQVASSGFAQNIILNALTAIQAQEELHALGANGILAAAGQTTIQPCEYVFPTTNFDDAINLARTFTDVVLGTLQDALAGLAAGGDTEYIPLIGSVIGQEGEQNGFFRTELGLATSQDLIPSELPFLTRSAAPFAFSALNQIFVVPGSCPNSNIIDIPIFGALKVVTSPIAAKTQELEFSFSKSGLNGTRVDDISVVYINQQNLPVVEKPTVVSQSNGVVTIKALFPYSKFLMNGLTIAAVTSSAGPFSSVSEVASATLFGPGLIEIN